MERRHRSESMSMLGRREFLKITGAMGGAFLLSNPTSTWAQVQKRISIATGGMGGVYYPLGGAISRGHQQIRAHMWKRQRRLLPLQSITANS